MNFEKAIDIVLQFEGFISDDQNDPGGLTKYGISQRAYPQIDVRNLSLEAAKEIYRKEYWDKCQCEKIPPRLRLLLFDTAVNCGVDYAVRSLQRLVKAHPDGILGPITIQKVRSNDTLELFTNYIAERAFYYGGLEGFRIFGRGWMRRLFKIDYLCNSSDLKENN